jgi:hypothetical protein
MSETKHVTIQDLIEHRVNYKTLEHWELFELVFEPFNHLNENLIQKISDSNISINSVQMYSERIFEWLRKLNKSNEEKTRLSKILYSKFKYGFHASIFKFYDIQLHSVFDSLTRDSSYESDFNNRSYIRFLSDIINSNELDDVYQGLKYMFNRFNDLKIKDVFFKYIKPPFKEELEALYKDFISEILEIFDSTTIKNHSFELEKSELRDKISHALEIDQDFLSMLLSFFEKHAHLDKQVKVQYKLIKNQVDLLENNKTIIIKKDNEYITKFLSIFSSNTSKKQTYKSELEPIKDKIIELGKYKEKRLDKEISEYIHANKNEISQLTTIMIKEILTKLVDEINSYGFYYQSNHNSLFTIHELLESCIDVNSKIDNAYLLEYFFNQWTMFGFSDIYEFSDDTDVGYYHAFINLIFSFHPNLNFWDEYNHHSRMDYFDEDEEEDDLEDDDEEDDDFEDDDEDDEFDEDDEDSSYEEKSLSDIKKPFIVNYFDYFVHNPRGKFINEAGRIVSIIPQGHVSVVEVEYNNAITLALCMDYPLKINENVDFMMNGKMLKALKVHSEPVQITAYEYKKKTKNKSNIIYIHPDYPLNETQNLKPTDYKHERFELNDTDYKHISNLENIDSIIKDEFHNKEFAQRLVGYNGWLLSLFSEEVRNDKKVVLSSVKDVGVSLIYASKYLQNDSEVIETASKSNEYVLIEGSKVYIVKLSGLKYGNPYGQVYTYSSEPNQFKKGDLEIGRLSRSRHSLVVEQTTLIDMNDLSIPIERIALAGINDISKFKSNNIIVEHILQNRPLNELIKSLKIDMEPFKKSINHKGEIGVVKVAFGLGGKKEYIFGSNGVQFKKGDNLLVGYPEEISEGKALSDVLYVNPNSLEFPLIVMCFVFKKIS